MTRKACFPEGIDAIFQLVKKRIPEADLNELFGEAHVRNRLRAIALWSGGYPREIVRLLQAFLELDTFPITADALELVLHRAGNTYRGIVYDSGAIDWLRTVYRFSAGRRWCLCDSTPMREGTAPRP